MALAAAVVYFYYPRGVETRQGIAQPQAVQRAAPKETVETATEVVTVNTEALSTQATGIEIPAVREGGEASRLIESFNSGEFRKAIRMWEGLGEKEKDETRVIAGAAYYRLGDLDTARRYLEQSLLSKETFPALKFLAFIYYESEDLDAAMRSAKKALSYSRDHELSALVDRLGREIRAQGSFIEEKVLHFRVLFDGYEHGGISRKVIDILEDAYNKIGGELGYYPSGPVTVILYTRESFLDTTRMPEWSGGLFDGKIRIPVAGAEGRLELLRRVLFHEYTHAVIRRMAKSPPLWINEGLAEYFSGGKEKTGQVIPLKSLEKSFLGLDGSMVRTAYLESFSAVSYLMENYGPTRMKRFLNSLGEGMGTDEAFRDAFGTGYDEFISTWGKK